MTQTAEELYSMSLLWIKWAKSIVVLSNSTVSEGLLTNKEMEQQKLLNDETSLSAKKKTLVVIDEEVGIERINAKAKGNILFLFCSQVFFLYQYECRII